ncbi:MAG: prephenate/arogenate dehydrogenase [Alkalinema sp. RU_4_3]|nr:prephenate/arogenate dehydrogenase [Alkalinema sp. RU_4_3]
MKIGIVGLGLIGGSIGLDLRALGHEVWGVSQRASTCDRAIARGAVDHASQDLGSLHPVEVVFVCTPIGLIELTIGRLGSHLDPATIITDVASVKGDLVARLTQQWPNFVGGHPMAGTAENGIEAALSELFVNNPYVLTPIETTRPRAIETVAQLAKELRAKLLYCDPHHHDRAVALISHLPVMVSASLITTCLGEQNPDILQLAQNLASSGFRDTSRVGGGNPELGVMMAQHNRAALLASLYAYRGEIDRLIEQVETQDWPGLQSVLETTAAGRSPFLKP